MSEHAEFQNSELKDCDLVMKGGITSGIVYPAAILALKDTYRFRSIGGTSSGAIAATLVAAAEYGRNAGGFEKLESAQKQLSGDHFLQNLFQPSPETAPLLSFFLDINRVLRHSKTKEAPETEKGNPWPVLMKLRSAVSWLVTALRLGVAHFTDGFVWGVIVGAACAVLFILLSGGALDSLGALIVIALFAVVGGLGFSLRELITILTQQVPANHLGICTGHHADTSAHQEVLTDWLHRQIQEISGKPRHQPLTFGDLRMKPLCDKPTADGYIPQDNIVLRMITSNLSQNLAYVLPFSDISLIFQKSDFRALFPDDVVQFLIQAGTSQKTIWHRHEAGKPPHCCEFSLPQGFYFLPEADKLPVVVAARLSLSFPILLSAIPLYSIAPETLSLCTADRSRLTLSEAQLQVNWFSDGGICSNFPIHFFDAWLPRRPTFGINLTALNEKKRTIPEDNHPIKPKYEETGNSAEEPIDSGRLASPSDEVHSPPKVKRVYLPQPDESITAEYFDFGPPQRPGLFPFLLGIFYTAQNNRDVTRTLLPSYRERIVQIRLRKSEGGLNLDMDPDVISDLIDIGKSAGDKLRNDFNFEYHQWIRFRVLMKQLEVNLIQFSSTLRHHPIYSDLFDNPRPDLSDFPYFDTREDWQAQLNAILQRLEALSDHIESWNQTDLHHDFDPAPHPEPTLRVTPKV
jgi:predicted acylesterase/phospholipase RssA